MTTTPDQEREWEVNAKLRWKVFGHQRQVIQSAEALEQAAKLSFHGGIDMVLLDYEPAGGPQEAAVGLQEPVMGDRPSVEVRGPLGATEDASVDVAALYEVATALQDIPKGSAVRLLLDPKTNRLYIVAAS